MDFLSLGSLGSEGMSTFFYLTGKGEVGDAGGWIVNKKISFAVLVSAEFDLRVEDGDFWGGVHGIILKSPWKPTFTLKLPAFNGSFKPNRY